MHTWAKVGNLEREVAIYKRLQGRGVHVSFVTYGNALDLSYKDQLDGIGIVCNHWGLPQQWYIRLISRLYPLLWWGNNVVLKSNQVQGADIALRVARFFGKKFIVRCGYLYSDFMERRYGLDSSQAQRARALEEEVFIAAHRIVVTTRVMREVVLKRYQVPEKKVSIIPNYVDTNFFRPNSDERCSSKRICFVGRLDVQKNLFALLKAIRGLDVELLIVGNGTLDEQLRKEVNLNRLPVYFLGNVPYRRLPEILNSATLFILPSHYEGHPKVLLEAMACGLSVIGTNVPGIRELICHRQTGYLCGTSPEEIREAIQDVLSDAGLCVRMGRNAREFVVKHFALDQIAEMELALLREVMSQ